MKRYDISESLGRMVTMDDGDWVSADIAVDLYEALKWLVYLHAGISKAGGDVPICAQEWDDALTDARAALMKADNE